MNKKRQASDRLIEEATALADAVSEYGYFGEMAQALRAGQRALNDGELAIEDAKVARRRLGDGMKIVAMARELWVESRA